MQKFVLALSTLPYRAAPPPFDKIVKDEGLLKWYPVAEKVAFLNNMKHARHQKSLILSAA